MTGTSQKIGRKIFVLDGHPDNGSFCGALARTAAEAAETAGQDVRFIRLSDLTFEPNLEKGYKEGQALEPDLDQVQRALAWCDHLIVVHPLWWSAAPAKLKGLFDRVLLPGFAYKFMEGKALPEQLLAGRSAHVLITSDTPSWYLRWVYGAGWLRIIKKQILEFCGFRNVRFNTLGPIKGSDETSRTGFLAIARKAGALIS